MLKKEAVAGVHHLQRSFRTVEEDGDAHTPQPLKHRSIWEEPMVIHFQQLGIEHLTHLPRCLSEGNGGGGIMVSWYRYIKCKGPC
jgi:hypothetical protein